MSSIILSYSILLMLYSASTEGLQTTCAAALELSMLTLFYKIINNFLPISVPSYYHHTQFPTRQHHRDHFILPQATLNTYKYSFYPRTIKDWNNLPINVIEARDINEVTYLILITIITGL